MIHDITPDDYTVPLVQQQIDSKYNIPNNHDYNLFKDNNWKYTDYRLFPILSRSEAYSRRKALEKWTPNINPEDNTFPSLVIRHVLSGIKLSPQLEAIALRPDCTFGPDDPYPAQVHLESIKIDPDPEEIAETPAPEANPDQDVVMQNVESNP